MADTINILSTFTGSGFHDTAVELALEALGLRARAVGYVEREAAAAATLLARMEHKTLGRAPVWCDCISRLDARPLRGWVDLLIGSPPCQPYSSAGKRLGNADERSHGDGEGPLVHLARIIEESDPALVWFENVPEWWTGGHFRSFGDRLCDLGFDFAEPVFATSAGLGNVHERERGFILGYTDRASRRFTRSASQIQRRAGAGGGCRAVGDANRLHQGRRQDAERGAERGATARGPGGELADGAGDGRSREQRRRRAREEPVAAHGGGPPLCPPHRNDYRRWAELVVGGLDPTLMPAVERGVSVVADENGAPAYSAGDLLRLGGNAVDPLVVAYAFMRSWRAMQCHIAKST